MIFGKIFYEKDSLEDYFKVLNNFFYEKDILNVDLEKIYVVVYYNNIPVSAAELVIDGEKFALNNIYTIEEYRKKGLADFACRMLIKKGFDNFAKEIIVFTDIKNKSFYLKLGFKDVGNVVEKSNIKMVLKLNEYLNHTCSWKDKYEK